MGEYYADIEIMPEEDEKKLIEPSEYLADVPSSMISGVLGMMGFAVACFVGLLAGNPGTVILLRAMLAMVLCAVVGRVLGVAGEVCVREFVSLYKHNRPKPDKPRELIELDRARQAHEQAVESMKKSG